jgi:CRISPR-associated protein Csm5
METITEKIKRSKETLGLKIPCTLEVLSPVHIGSGVKLANGIDFTTTKDTITIVSKSQLMVYLEQNPEQLEKFIRSDYKLDNINVSTIGRNYTLNGERVFDISEFERNGNGTPYIPGSSLKGAIRTVILTQIFNSWTKEKQRKFLEKAIESEKGEKWASQPIMEEIFGDDSNYNLMRTLQVYDAHFKNDVDVEKLHLLSLKSRTDYGWKKMGKDKQTKQPFPLQDNPKYSTSIFVESLPIGSKADFSINLNNFLINNPVAKVKLQFNENSLKAVSNFILIINTHSKQKLEMERKFFEDLKSPKKLINVLSEIDNLLKQIGALKEDEFILRISWGSGWKGMTGDFLTDNWLNTFRDKFGKGMGKPGFSIFPKTRRIVFEENEPKHLTGWIKIKLNDKIVETKTKTTIPETIIDESDWAAKLEQYKPKSQKRKR